MKTIMCMTTEEHASPCLQPQFPAGREQRFVGSWSFRIFLLMIATAVTPALLAAPADDRPGSTAVPPSANSTVIGESVVLAAELPSRLCLKNVSSVVVRSEYEAGQGLAYEEGRDYVLDLRAGEIRRTPNSRIPDYSRHPMYGMRNFDNRTFKEPTSNIPFFVWIDHQSSDAHVWAESAPQDQLARVRSKLQQGGRFNVGTYGDSITAGGEASRPEFAFTRRYMDHLRSLYPNADIVHTDVSIPGKTSREGIALFAEKLGTLGQLDLILIGFGMNDHNRGGPEPQDFKANLIEIVRLAREQSPEADIVLFSAFPPNADWQLATHRMQEYADATREAARASACAYADVYGVWQKVLLRKDQSSLLANNINHPNNFGHWLYFRAFAAMGL